MATRAGYSNPRSVSLSQLQKNKVTGASSFYVYYCKLKKYLKQGDIAAIQKSDSTSLTVAKESTKGLPTPAELIKSLSNYHKAGRLRPTDYAQMEAMVRSART